MAPKRKATNPPTSGKTVKKGNQIKKESTPALTDDNFDENVNTGKTNYEKK